MVNHKVFVFDLTYAELSKLVESWDAPAYRTRQIWQGIYQNYWNSPDQFTNLPKILRTKMFDSLAFSHLQESQILFSKDNETQKTLFMLPDGQAIETVLMRYHKRRTLCISTQAGCGMGCVFCATGQMGFRRHLSSGEIVEQVIYYARLLNDMGEKVTNVVVMGMGEPFHNYENTLSAIARLNEPDGFNLGLRRFTISTVGLVPMIKRFSEEQHQINLAISLHASDDELRASMLPINHKYPVQELIQACKEYVQKTHRRITFEWALIYDVNDSEDEAHKLARLLHGILCHVNVIPLNPTTGYAGQATTEERARAFQAVLTRSGIPCTIRIRRGIDIQAGCGQLAIQSS
jgi:23S rRNA (adenine2503-C2)-methyltransferase